MRKFQPHVHGYFGFITNISQTVVFLTFHSNKEPTLDKIPCTSLTLALLFDYIHTSAHKLEAPNFPAQLRLPSNILEVSQYLIISQFPNNHDRQGFVRPKL